MRYYISCFEDFCHTGQFVERKLIENTEKFIENITITMSQCRILMETCPQQANFGDEIIEIPILTPREIQFDLHKNEPKWIQITTNITEILNTTNRLQILLHKVNNGIPAVEQDLFTPQYVFVQENIGISNALEGLAMKLLELQHFFANALFDSLNWLRENAVTLQKGYGKSNECFKDGVKIDLEMEKLVEKILIALQNVYKKYNAKEQIDGEEIKEEGDEDAYVLNEDHFKGLILRNLDEDLACLQFKGVFKALHKTAAKVLNVNPSVNIEAKNTVLLVVPLLEQLSLLYQYYITQQVSSYRITCKLTSILLNIFINLVSKVSGLQRKCFLD